MRRFNGKDDVLKFFKVSYYIMLLIYRFDMLFRNFIFLWNLVLFIF